PSSHLILLLNDPATTELYTLSLHDALPICDGRDGFGVLHGGFGIGQEGVDGGGDVFGADGVEAGEAGEVEQGVGHCRVGADRGQDRKSTRLNSSHVKISYAVFCLKKKK